MKVPQNAYPNKFSFVIPTKSESARKFSPPIISMTISPFVKPVQIPLKHNTKVEFSAHEVISDVLLTFTPLKA